MKVSSSMLGVDYDLERLVSGGIAVIVEHIILVSLASDQIDEFFASFNIRDHPPCKWLRCDDFMLRIWSNFRLGLVHYLIQLSLRELLVLLLLLGFWSFHLKVLIEYLSHIMLLSLFIPLFLGRMTSRGRGLVANNLIWLDFGRVAESRLTEVQALQKHV